MDHIEEANFWHRGVCRIHMLEHSRRIGRLLMTNQRQQRTYARSIAALGEISRRPPETARYT